DDEDVRGADARYDEVPSLDVRLWRIRAEVRAARVPAEVVQLVAAVGELDLADQPAVLRRGRVRVEDADRIAAAVAVPSGQDDVRERLGRRIHRHAGRRIERRV